MAYCGEDIVIDIERFQPGNIPVNLDDYYEIILHLYTKSSDIRKFSKTTRAGYTKLVRISATKYQATLNSSVTAEMSAGTMQVGIRFIKTDASIPDGYLDKIATSGFIALYDSTVKTENFPS
jgi:hypothetical protein